jgi:hypothetical protein
VTKITATGDGFRMQVGGERRNGLQVVVFPNTKDVVLPSFCGRLRLYGQSPAITRKVASNPARSKTHASAKRHPQHLQPAGHGM